MICLSCFAVCCLCIRDGGYLGVQRGSRGVEGCRGVKWWAECAVIAGGPHNCTLCGAISGATWPAPTSIGSRFSLSLPPSPLFPFLTPLRRSPFPSHPVSPSHSPSLSLSHPCDFFSIFAHPRPIFEALTNDRAHPCSSLKFLSSYLRR